MTQTGPALFLKSSVDRMAAACGLLLCAPVLAVVALAIRASLGSPVFFRQPRPGRGGIPFTLVKFRTMRELRAPDGSSLPDAVRLTPLGQFLRSTSLDELPQLWNVLCGELSLVGPRPLLMQYLPLYSPAQARRHDVLPGITGWAQVHGRNAISWEQKFTLDVWYVEHWSPWLDARILLLTAAHLAKRDGISREGHATMPAFTGSLPAGGQQGEAAPSGPRTSGPRAAVPTVPKTHRRPRSRA